VKADTKLVVLESIGIACGFVWIVASLAALYFLVMAVFSDGAWSRFFWTLATGIVAQWLARSFRDNQIRVAFEADKVSKGSTPEEARREWLERYNKGEL
jgi:hypothetical protein